MAEPTAFEIYGPKARKEHMPFVDSFVPGFRAFSLDTDIHLGIWNKKLPAGVYFLKAGDDAQTALVYTAVFDPQQLEQLAEGAKDYDEHTDEEGYIVREIRDEAQINVNMEPLEVEEGRYLTFLEAVAWAAITTAESDEIRSAIFKSSYRVVVNEPEPGPLTVKTGKTFANAMRGKPNRKNELWETGSDFLADMGALQITAESEKALETALASNKALIQLNALATASDYKYERNRTLTVNTTIDDMLRERGMDLDAAGKSTKSKWRKKAKEEVLSLAGVSWNFTDESGDFIRVPLAGGTCSVIHGNVSFVFSSEFMGTVLNRGAGRLALNPAILRTDEKRNPYAMPIGFKLASHSYQNIGKPNECTLSVEKLLEFVNGIPTYEQVKESDRAYTRRIIEPLERDLRHLVEIGFLESWDYCHAKGEPLTDAEQAARLDESGEDGTLPYDIAINANIQWQLSKTYEEQRAETVKSRERRAELAEAAKQREADRKKRIERKKEGFIARKAAEIEAGKE